MKTTCPLCGGGDSRPSWLGATNYLDRAFEFVECLSCETLYCDPMPDADVLGEMYGPSYEKVLVRGAEMDDPKEPGRVVKRLRDSPRGVFLDYGCGPGALLIEAQTLGWEAVGVEFDGRVVAAVADRIGARVLTVAEADAVESSLADVLHLGDVIEHLTDLDRQMPRILRLLKPGGVLIAQGPLEGNGSLFIAALRFAHWARGRRLSRLPPYHVMLATAKGQRTFFNRFGLEEIEFTMSEVSWPAPSRISLKDLARPRQAGLFLVRRASQACSRLRPDHWGNRYFYAGRQRGLGGGEPT